MTPKYDILSVNRFYFLPGTCDSVSVFLHKQVSLVLPVSLFLSLPLYQGTGKHSSFIKRNINTEHRNNIFTLAFTH